MLEIVLTIPPWFEFLATITGAIGGAMAASRARYDILGTIVMATIMGLFGGVIRDIMLQNYGIYAFQRPELIVTCVITGIVVFYFGTLVTYLNRAIDLIDTVSIGLWAVISAGKALSAGLGVVPAVILGLISAIGGGVTRDVIMNRPVKAFQPGSLSGTAVILGLILYCALRSFNILDDYSAYICALLIIALQLGAMVFGWRTKPAHDLTDVVADAVAKPVRALRDPHKND